MTDSVMWKQVPAWTVCVCGHLVSRHDAIPGATLSQTQRCKVKACKCKSPEGVLLVEKSRLFSVVPDELAEHPLTAGISAATGAGVALQRTEGYVCKEDGCTQVEGLSPLTLSDGGSVLLCGVHASVFLARDAEPEWKRMLDNF